MGSHPISLNIGPALLVFGLSYGLAQIQHRLVQYPVKLDGSSSNKLYRMTSCYFVPFLNALFVLGIPSTAVAHVDLLLNLDYKVCIIRF